MYLSASAEEKIDALFSAFTIMENPGCAVGIVKNDEVLFQRGFGMANLENLVPISEKTVFHVSSISKQFTAACILLLEQKGKIDSCEDIRKYLPQFPDYGKKIRVKDLIYMTNGIRDFYSISQYYMGVHENDYLSEKEVMKLITGFKNLLFEPGTEWSYGNTGYFLLSEIIKSITAKTLTEFATEEIFKPLGMENTLFRNDRTKIIPNKAEGYAYYPYLHYKEDKNKKETDLFCRNSDTYELTGPGQLWTNMEDYLLWEMNFYNNKLGINPKEFSEKIIKPGTLENKKEVNYSYGLFLGEKNGRKILYHEGNSCGFNSVVYRVPSEMLSIVVFSNYDRFLTEKLEVLKTEVYYLLEEIVLELDIPLQSEGFEIDQPGIIELNKKEIKKRIGYFQNPNDSFIIEIFEKNEKLYIDLNGSKYIEVSPGEENILYTDEDDWEFKINFEKDKPILVKETKNGIEKGYLPFYTPEKKKEYFSEFEGNYFAQELETTYKISLSKKGIFLENLNFHRDAMDLEYLPALKDSFFTFAPTYLTGYYSLIFVRDSKEAVESFVFLDLERKDNNPIKFVKIV